MKYELIINTELTIKTNNQLIASHYLDPKKQSRYAFLILSLQQLNFFSIKKSDEF